MSSYTLNISGRKSGCLLQNKTVVPWNGPILTVTNEPVHGNAKGCFDLVQAAIDKSDRVAAGDRYGNIYLFDAKKDRFWRVCHLNHCCMFLTFTQNTSSDLIVAVSDCSISLLNSERCLVIKTARVHKTCVNHISVDETGSRILTSSIEEAAIWNLDGLTLLHKLADGKDINILKAFFLPVKNYIVCAFRNSCIYLWNSNNLKFKTEFVCQKDGSLWMKAIDGSKDGEIIVCGGKSDLLFIWDVETSLLLHKISLAKFLTNISEVLLPSSYPETNVILILDQNGKLHMYDVKAETRSNQLTVDDGKVVSVFECTNKLAVITSSGALKIYDLKTFFQEPPKPKPKKAVSVPTVKKMDELKKTKTKTTEIDAEYMKKFLLKFKEYPPDHRTFIWSQLLDLPRNKDFINFYVEDVDHSFSLEGQKFTELDKAVERALLRQLSMLTNWSEFLSEVSILPDLILPFVKMLHKDMQMCFEILVTLICNWCQNWFLYLPFPPFNILYTIESLLVYHDRPLLHHFLQHKISPEIYAYYLLQSSFFHTFAHDEWLTFWDHVFSNQPSFLIFAVIALLVVYRDVLFRFENPSDFKAFYFQNSLSVSSVIEKAYHLMKSSPICFDPGPVIGQFKPLPKEGYPLFTRIIYLEADFQTLKRSKYLTDELDYVKRRALQISNLKELKGLLEVRNNLLSQIVEMKDVAPLQELENKVERLQRLIHEHMVTKDEKCALEKAAELTIDLEQQQEAEDPLKAVEEVLSLRERFTERLT